LAIAAELSTCVGVGALKPLLVMREPVTMMSDGEAEAGAGAGVSGAETGGGAAFWASAGGQRQGDQRPATGQHGAAPQATM
jgi:hypothetical protein